MLRAVTDDGAAVAVKVSRDLGISGLLASAALAGPIPSGIPAPLRSRSGKPYSIVDGRRLSLTPWIPGRRAFETGMDAHQWRSFGALLSRVHATQVSPAVANQLPAEDYRTPEAATARTLDKRIREQEARHRAGTDDPLTGALIRDWCAAGDALAMILAQIEALGDELRAGSASRFDCVGRLPRRRPHRERPAQ